MDTKIIDGTNYAFSRSLSKYLAASDVLERTDKLPSFSYYRFVCSVLSFGIAVYLGVMGGGVDHVTLKVLRSVLPSICY